MPNDRATGLKPVPLPVALIDPGHGGHDPGAVYDGVREADLNLAIALRLKALWSTGYKPVPLKPVALYLTREEDRFVALAHRAEMANELGADLFVSIHCDASPRPEVSGFSVHHAPGAEGGEILARCLHGALVRALPGRRDRGIIPSSFLVLKRTAMPACLVECEFLSHAESRAWLQTPEAQNLLAEAVRQGLEEFLHAAV